MWVQITEFDVPGMTREEYEEWCVESVSAISQIPGIRGKLFCRADDTSRAVGIYTFVDREHAMACWNGELQQAAIVNNPAIKNVRTLGIPLLERPTYALDEALAASPVAR